METVHTVESSVPLGAINTPDARNITSPASRVRVGCVAAVAVAAAGSVVVAVADVAIVDVAIVVAFGSLVEDAFQNTRT